MTDNDRLVIIQFTSENKLNIIFCWLSVSLCCINGGMVSPLQFSSSDDLACFGAHWGPVSQKEKKNSTNDAV